MMTIGRDDWFIETRFVPRHRCNYNQKESLGGTKVVKIPRTLSTPFPQFSFPKTKQVEQTFTFQNKQT